MSAWQFLGRNLGRVPADAQIPRQIRASWHLCTVTTAKLLTNACANDFQFRPVHRGCAWIHNRVRAFRILGRNVQTERRPGSVSGFRIPGSQSDIFVLLNIKYGS